MPLALTSSAVALDLPGVQPAALDQPRINAYLARSIGGTPLIADLGGLQSFNIQAFFDTGASGILLSNNTSDLLDVIRSQFNGVDVVFSDVGVAGSDQFNVSESLFVGLAPFTPDADVDNLDTYQTVYGQGFGPVRAQIGPIGLTDPNPLLADLDVFGMPLMQGKVVVMDGRPVNTFLDTIRTYVFNAGSTDPLIPTTDKHIRLSYADFDRFTQTEPAGAAPPTLNGNPFIGPDPVAALDPGAPPDPTPPVRIAFNGRSSEGSWLLDTGAAASLLSTRQAGNLAVRYVPGSFGTDSPVLETFDPSDPQAPGVPVADQFTLTIGGIGGTFKAAGFYLGSMLLRTDEGDAGNDADPNHIRYLDAPVLVADITVRDLVTQQNLTLDGIFGMNYLVASALLIEADPFPIIDRLTRSRIEQVVFDQPAGRLGLSIGAALPQDELSWFGALFGENEWDIAFSTNWIAGLTLAAYEDGDAVTFGDLTLNPDVEIVEPVAPGGVRIANDVQEYNFSGSPIRGLTGLLKTGAGTVTFRNRNAFTGATVIEGGAIVYAEPQDVGPLLVRVGGLAVFETGQRFEKISVEGGRVEASPGGTKVIESLALGVSGGRFDLNEHRIVLDVGSMPLSDLRALLLSGYASGAWTGEGLMSSAAAAAPGRGIGYGDNALLGYATFGGVAVDGFDVLVAYTFLADANLDGRVDVSDLGLLAGGWQSVAAFWTDGDFNYDGVVDVADLGLLATNWQAGVTGPAAPGASFGIALAAAGWSSIPEPALLAPAALGAILLARRRR